MLIEGAVVKIIKINPYEREIKIAELKDIDNNFSTNLEKEAKEVEAGIKIIAYPVIGEEKSGFFYYVAKKDNQIGKIYTFNGIGSVFCDEVNDEMLEKIKKRVVW